MAYTVEATETFERELKKKHKDKIKWLEKIKEKLERYHEYGKPLR
jgi:mRNA-degrading endonuclease RelE of RelBE toxin-antitoxin system